MQILEENVAGLGKGSTVVGAAVAPVALAEKGSTVNFVGAKDQYWGFRVLPDDKITTGMTVHKVPTKSLADIKVPCLPYVNAWKRTQKEKNVREAAASD